MYILNAWKIMFFKIVILYILHSYYLLPMNYSILITQLMTIYNFVLPLFILKHLVYAIRFILIILK